MERIGRRVARRAGAALGGTLIVLVAAASSAGAQQAPACGELTEVRSGDTLTRIAARCGVSVPALLAANPGVRGNADLAVGASVAVPAPGTPEPTPEAACGPYYTVRSGDTVEDVAAMCGLDVALLTAANGPLPAPLGLAAGSQIRIPPLPRRVAAGETRGLWTADAAGPAVSADAGADADTTALTADAPLVRLTGVLRQGDECVILMVEDEDGEEDRRVGLLGQVNAFDPGDTVTVLGVEREDEECGTEMTLEPRIIWVDGS